MAPLFKTAVFLFVLAFSQSVGAHGPGENKHDLEKIPAKPEGMIEFKGSQTPGSEYMQENNNTSTEKVDKDPFHTRGSHDQMHIGESRAKIETNKALLARGKTIYKHMCVFCHGDDGNGGGPAMGFLYPWPRDFRTGIFKFRSTATGTLPRDEDIYRTIIRGVPGTSMPNWSAALSPEDTWALVNLIKSFSPRFRNEPPGEPIKMSKEQPVTPESIEKGKELFTKNKCDDCHGVSGTGDGKLADSLMDAWKHAVFVHDITNPGYIKAGTTAKDIFRTLSTGLDGTPMESYVHLPEQDRWNIAHFVRSRFAKELKKASFETDVYSKKVTGKLSTEPTNPIWNNVKTTDLILRPLSARRGAVETINFASVHNDKRLAVRVQWEDPNRDEDLTLGDQYLDQVAVQFALGSVTLHTHGHNEPFWGMGNRGKPVNIWHWKAGQKKEFVASTKGHNTVMDIDMDALLFGGVSPSAALNQPTGASVIELNAEGFSTLTPQPKDKQGVTGEGFWKDNVWTVVFLRNMDKSGKWDADFKKPDPVLIAFAVWDGLKEDRNGRKVVSVWQRLNIEGITNNKKQLRTSSHHHHH
tara:strand:- start:223 stop:1968 length:1746 start_codon:yes stop_codon:yes gene_type:complete